nr:fumarylacetoacetate hydrolase family protein [Streptomyces tsukubensis NRRL18488]
MLMPVAELLAHITARITLEPGDTVLTGAPAGAVPLRAGDRVGVAVDGIGTVRNPMSP